MRDQNINDVRLWDYNKRMVYRRKDALYRQANQVWSKYKLNTVESIGPTMRLLKKSQPKSIEEWHKSYNKSGESLKKAMTKHTLKSYHNDITMLRRAVLSVKREYGRTDEDMLKIAKDFQNKLSQEGIRMDLETCYNFTFIKCVDDTYLGYRREQAAERILTDFCNKHGYVLVDTDENTDVHNAVDFEIWKDGSRVVGLQVKGDGYRKSLERGEDKELQRIDSVRRQNNQKYIEKYGVPVFYVFITDDFQLSNTQVLNQIAASDRDKPLPSLDEKLNKLSQKSRQKQNNTKCHDRWCR